MLCFYLCNYFIVMWVLLFFQTIEHLPTGGKLHYVDLSDNDISVISDLGHLKELKVLQPFSLIENFQHFHFQNLR